MGFGRATSAGMSNLVKSVFAVFAIACLIGVGYVVTQNKTIVLMSPEQDAKSQQPIVIQEVIKQPAGAAVSNYRTYASVYGDGKIGTQSGPLANMRKFGHSYRLAGLEISKMSAEERMLTGYSYMDNVDILCYRKLRMGNLGDGGWEICDDPDVRPKDNDCIIYSFGINNEFSFDDHAAKAYGCHVYCFDPSMNKGQHDRGNLVHFYPWGIGGKTEVNGKKWQMYTFQDIRKQLGHENKKIAVVKMDVESSEYAALPEMLRSNMFASEVGIKQLLVEYHVQPTSQGADKIELLSGLEKAGFGRFYVHKNPACKTSNAAIPWTVTVCWEIHYMRPLS